MSLKSDRIVELLRAAGESTRLRILILLSREELAVTELTSILDQSQPRVSRHLKLLTEAGLIERFPDGAWVFYRLPTGGDYRVFLNDVIAHIEPDDQLTTRDAERLAAVRQARTGAAGAYFTQNASHWDQIRSLYVAENAVESAILKAAGPGPFVKVVDLGSGTGRMLTLLAPRAKGALGLDLSQQMLNIARARVAEAGLTRCELRHGDIFATKLPSDEADLVVVHQVLHYLNDPAAAIRESARLVAAGGRLLIVDFAPHRFEFLRDQHQHRRLGFSDGEMDGWLHAAGLGKVKIVTLPPSTQPGLTVKVWTAERALSSYNRSAA